MQRQIVFTIFFIQLLTNSFAQKESEMIVGTWSLKDAAGNSQQLIITKDKFTHNEMWPPHKYNPNWQNVNFFGTYKIRKHIIRVRYGRQEHGQFKIMRLDKDSLFINNPKDDKISVKTRRYARE